MLLRPLGTAPVAALLVLMAFGAPASAGTRTVITLDAPFGGTEMFTATGGVVCTAGESVTDESFMVGGGRGGGPAVTFHIAQKTFDCGGGDTFLLRVNAATRFGSGQDQGGWSVIGGTGAYATLTGGGSLVGTYYFDDQGLPIGIVDVYTGFVKL